VPAHRRRDGRDGRRRGKPPEQGAGARGGGRRRRDPTEIEVDLGEFCVTACSPRQPDAPHRLPFVRQHQRGLGEGVQTPPGRQQAPVSRAGPRDYPQRDITDLTDPNLGLVKRLILERPQTLGKPLLREVIISDYSFIEQ